jgi:hypothetical protein
MGRTPKLTEDVKHIIKYIYDKHKTWSHREIQKNILGFSIEVIGRKLLAKEVPGHTLVNNYIRLDLKPKQEQIDKSGLDRPWSIVSLYRPEWALHPEALPYVLKIWAKSQMEEGKELDSERGIEPLEVKTEAPEYNWMFKYHDNRGILTVRQAIWISRLIFIFKDSSSEKTSIDKLWDVAQFLANDERLLQLEGEYPDNRGSMLRYWVDDAILYTYLPQSEPAATKITVSLLEKFLAKYPRGYKKGIESENDKKDTK